MVALVGGGLFGLAQLKTEGFPQISINLAVVSTVLPGGTASDVEEQVTNRIEGAIKNVDHVKEISSRSDQNISLVTVTFDDGVAVDGPLADIRSKVQSVILPAAAQKPDVMVPALDSPAYVVALAEVGADTARLSELGHQFETQALARKEIASVTPLYPITDRLLVQIEWAKLADSGVSLTQISQVLPGVALNFPVGQGIVSGQRQPIVIQGNLSDLDQLRSTIVGQKPGLIPKPVRLQDIATVTPTADNNDAIEHVSFRQDGQLVRLPAYLYSVQLKQDQSLLKADPALQSFFKGLSGNDSLGKNSQVAVVSDSAKMTRSQVAEIVYGALGEQWSGPVGFVGYLFGGIWLLLLALLIFLNWRVALVGAVAIPLSFLFTFIILWLFGIQLNTIVLFSFILVLGLIVDPAIVVLESMQRYIDLGQDRRQAIMHAVENIGPGLFIAVLTSIIVFLPFGLVSGIFGQIINFIPKTVIPALIASYFIPLSLLTWFGAKLLRPTRGEVADDESEGRLWPFARWLVHTNERILRWPLMQVAIVIAGLVIPIAVTGALFAQGKIKQVQFSQPADASVLSISAQFERSRTADQKEQIVDSVETALADQSAVANAFLITQTSTSLAWTVELSDPKDRVETSKDIKTAVEQALRSNDLATYSVAESGVGTPSSAYPIQIQIFDTDLSKLKAAAIETGDVARATSGITAVDDGYTDHRDNELHIVLDRSKTEQVGLNPFSVGQSLQVIYGEKSIGRIFDPTRQETVDFVLSGSATSQKANIDELADIPLATPLGKTVRLGDIASLEERQAEPVIGHVNGRRYIQVQAKVADATSAATLQKQISGSWTSDKLKQFGLAPDALENRGEFDDIAKGFTQLGQALVAALFLTYVALVLFFGSFSQPLIILFAVPLTFLGIFPAIALLGGQLGFLETLGIITLIGLVENVGIFVIDYANRHVRMGMDKRKAIALATGVRFRPIFLTKITALGGLLPLAVFSPFWRGLSVVVIAGILVSGILSLFTTPILYLWFSSRPHLRRRRKTI